MISSKEIKDHLKYLQRLKNDLKYGYKTPLRKRDRIKPNDNIHNRIRDNGSK